MTSGRKISVLHDNPPLAGKKLFLLSIVSPESRQKNDVYGFKLHDVCEDEQEARDLAQYYRDMDPDFDVLVGTVGKWCPFIFDPTNADIDAVFADNRLTELIREHRNNRRMMDTKWKTEHEKDIAEIKKGATQEGQQELANRKEPAAALYFRIKQLEKVIKARQDELYELRETYHTKYSKEERAEVKKAKLPLSEPAPMQYTLLSSEDIEAIHGKQGEENVEIQEQSASS